MLRQPDTSANVFNQNRHLLKLKCIFVHLFLGGTIDVTVHEMLEDGRVRELYKATGGPWGGNMVNEDFVKYLCDVFSEEVIETMKHEFPSDFVDLLHDFEEIKHRINLSNEDEVRLNLPRCLDEVYLSVKNKNLQYAFDKDNVCKTKGAYLNRHRLSIPTVLIAKMIEEVAKRISSHLSSLLKKKGNENLNFIVMVGGFSNSPIVIQEIRNQVQIPVIVPENPEVSVAKGAVMFGWNPNMFKSRKSKRTYGTDVT